jgi:hypothetical protein
VVDDIRNLVIKKAPQGAFYLVKCYFFLDGAWCSFLIRLGGGVGLAFFDADCLTAPLPLLVLPSVTAALALLRLRKRRGFFGESSTGLANFSTFTSGATFWLVVSILYGADGASVFSEPLLKSLLINSNIGVSPCNVFT